MGNKTADFFDPSNKDYYTLRVSFSSGNAFWISRYMHALQFLNSNDSNC